MRFPDVLVQLKHLETQLRGIQFDIDQLWRQVGPELRQQFRGEFDRETAEELRDEV